MGHNDTCEGLETSWNESPQGIPNVQHRHTRNGLRGLNLTETHTNPQHHRWYKEAARITPNRGFLIKVIPIMV